MIPLSEWGVNFHQFDKNYYVANKVNVTLIRFFFYDKICVVRYVFMCLRRPCLQRPLSPNELKYCAICVPTNETLAGVKPNYWNSRGRWCQSACRTVGKYVLMRASWVVYGVFWRSFSEKIVPMSVNLWRRECSCSAFCLQ